MIARSASQRLGAYPHDELMTSLAAEMGATKFVRSLDDLGSEKPRRTGGTILTSDEEDIEALALHARDVSAETN